MHFGVHSKGAREQRAQQASNQTSQVEWKASRSNSRHPNANVKWPKTGALCNKQRTHALLRLPPLFCMLCRVFQLLSVYAMWMLCCTPFNTRHTVTNLHHIVSNFYPHFVAAKCGNLMFIACNRITIFSIKTYNAIASSDGFAEHSNQFVTNASPI